MSRNTKKREELLLLRREKIASPYGLNRIELITACNMKCAWLNRGKCINIMLFKVIRTTSLVSILFFSVSMIKKASYRRNLNKLWIWVDNIIMYILSCKQHVNSPYQRHSAGQVALYITHWITSMQTSTTKCAIRYAHTRWIFLAGFSVYLERSTRNIVSDDEI